MLNLILNFRALAAEAFDTFKFKKETSFKKPAFPNK